MLCPTCKKALTVGPDQNPHRPFCSERCRLVDLGAWFDGGHRISSPLSEAELDEGTSACSDDDPSGRLD